MPTIGELEKSVVKAVKAAAKIAAHAHFTIEEKSSAENIVTSADLEVQFFLYRKLKELLPDCGFLGEENHLSDLRHDYVWVIDPIDGTTNFSRGIPECAVSVALLYKREPVLGVVYNIFKKDLFTARKGGGAKLNGKRITVSEKPFENALFCTAMSVYKKEYAPVCFDIISEVYMQSNDIRRLGSCAVELCYLAAGMCELYFEIRVFPWDYAAAYLVLREAGGYIGGLHGKELNFDEPTVVIAANSLDNYEKINHIISERLPKTPYEETL